MQELIERLDELTEGLIRVPPKLYAEIKAWVISAVAVNQVQTYEKLKEEAKRDGKDTGVHDHLIAKWKPMIKQRVKVAKGNVAMKTRREFPIDLDDWPSLKRIQKGGQSPRYKKVVVYLVDGMRRGQASFHADTGTISMEMPGWFDPKDVKKFDQTYGKALRHELIHMAQELMTGFIGGEDPVVGGVLRRRPRPGMPSKKLMTPEIHQHLQKPEFGDENPEVKAVRKRLERQGLKGTEMHHLDDLEFYTTLADTIDDFREVPLDGLTRAEVNKVVSIFTGSIEEPPNIPKWKRFDPRRKIYPLMHPQGPPRRDPSILKPSDTFLLWKRSAKGKWKKAVKELSKSVFA